MGRVQLSIAAGNSYTGNTTISQGTLTMTTAGSIAGSPNIIVATGAAFAGPSGGPAYTLAAGQTLSNNGPAAID